MRRRSSPVSISSWTEARSPPLCTARTEVNDLVGEAAAHGFSIRSNAASIAARRFSWAGRYEPCVST
jgi:hypothetical protein